MKFKAQTFVAIALIFIGTLLALKLFQSGKTEAGRVTALDGRLSLDLPAGWKTVESLNPLANLKVGDEVADVYLIVVSETKKDSKESRIEGYSRFTRQRLTESMKNVREQGPWMVTVGAHRALRYEILGTSQDGMDLIYLHTIVETPDYFHQVVGWGQPANYTKNRTVMRTISDGLRQDGR